MKILLTLLTSICALYLNAQVLNDVQINRTIRLPLDTLPTAQAGSKAFKGNKEWTKKASGFWEESGGVVDIRAGNGLTKYTTAEGKDSIGLGGGYSGFTALTAPAGSVFYNAIGNTGYVQSNESVTIAGSKDGWLTSMDAATGQRWAWSALKSGQPQTSFGGDTIGLYQQIIDETGTLTTQTRVSNKAVRIKADTVMLNPSTGTQFQQGASGYSFIVRDTTNGAVLQIPSEAVVLKQTKTPLGTTSLPVVTLEYTETDSRPDTTFTGSYSYIRQAADASSLATADITSVVYDGVSRSFTNPAPGGSNNGTATVTFTKNVNKTVPLVITSADGKTNPTTTATLNWSARRYWGFVNDTTNLRSGGGGVDAVITALSNELNNSKGKTWTTGTPTGAQFFVYAYVGTAGALSQFYFNGNPSILAMNSVSRLFRNARGDIRVFFLYWTKNPQTIGSNIIAE